MSVPFLISVIFGIIAAIGFVIAKVEVGRVKAAEAERDAANARIAAAMKAARAEHAEVERLKKLSEKTEEIHAEQIENRDRAGSFDGTLDVLQDVSGKRSRGSVPGPSDSDD